MLEINTNAPNFTLFDANEQSVSLSDFKGKKVVLYFYPKDNTPGCTKQACAFAAHFERFKNNDIVVVGISKDSVKSHKKFAEKYNLPFILLADSEKEVIQMYDVWVEKKLYGKLGFGVQRATYIINEEGMIIHALPKVKPDTNALQILELLDGGSNEQYY